MARVTGELVARAKSGDEEAFGQLVEPFRGELRAHCYRILGSVHDAEDALQETLFAAWRGLGGYEARSSVRTWLYRIATSRSLNAVRSRSRRPPVEVPMGGTGLPEPSRLGEVSWIEPYPDRLLEGLADTAPGPDVRYETSEAISLAFVVALQLLPPRQRAVLILRDVLDFHAGEVAQMLESTEESVTSALKRARATLQRQLAGPEHGPPPPPHSPAERELVERFTRAFEAGDADAVASLLTEDVLLTMPPTPFEWLGPELAGRFLRSIWTSLGSPPRLVAARANGQPAFALYVDAPDGRGAQALGLLVLTLSGGRVSAMTRFEPGVLPGFGLDPG
ncbi:MAG: RNA polymerase subunit sigma-70 [Candidatus Dormibacteraeota bacterium]|nr:RNA polymerase subunit sigma-70 [Candidatus Dormibacteraeota bacterium]